jgi:hypothetical protein
MREAGCTQNCGATATLEPGGRASISTSALVRGVRTSFRVLFADEPEPPTNSLGYVIAEPPLPPQPTPPQDVQDVPPAPAPAPAPPPAPAAPSATSLLLLGGINGQIEPKLDLSNTGDATKPLILSPDHPYLSDHRRFFKGTASVEARLIVPQWGFGEGTLTVKDGEYARDSTLSLSTSKYRLVLQSAKVQFAFGKIAFASPSAKVALNEVGEGAQLEFGERMGLKQAALNASVIVKRQRHPDLTTKPGRDDNALLFQYTNVPVNLGIFDKAGFYALFGRDENQDDEHSYAVAGTELKINMPAGLIGAFEGFTSFYLSRRGQGKFDDGTRGGVFLTNVIYKPKSRPKDGVTAYLGFGSADDASTSRDEGYISENQGFAPDIIFFGMLTRPLRFGDTPGIGFGLGNKTYASLGYSLDGWSALTPLARLILGDKGVISSNSALSFHKYNLREDRAAHAGRDAGWEVDLKFAIETLPRVRVNVGLGYYSPGDAVNDIIRKDMWAITSGVVISDK